MKKTSSSRYGNANDARRKMVINSVTPKKPTQATTKKSGGSIQNTSSAPKIKQVTAIGDKPAKGVTRATTKQTIGIKGGFEVKKGGGSTPAKTNYTNNQLAVGAIQASAKDAHVKFSGRGNKNNSIGGSAKVRKGNGIK